MQPTFTTRSEFVDALRSLIAEGCAAGARELWFCDPDFAEWPLNDAPLIEQLTRWGAPQRRLTLIAQHYDEVHRRHPRFVEWRRVWGHLVDARIPAELQAGDHPTLLLVDEVAGLRLLDPLHWRGLVSREPGQLRLQHQELDAISQRSVPGFAATILGL